jgi:hypothetical protein
MRSPFSPGERIFIWELITDGLPGEEDRAVEIERDIISSVREKNRILFVRRYG